MFTQIKTTKHRKCAPWIQRTPFEHTDRPSSSGDWVVDRVIQTNQRWAEDAQVGHIHSIAVDLGKLHLSSAACACPTVGVYDRKRAPLGQLRRDRWRGCKRPSSSRCHRSIHRRQPRCATQHHRPTNYEICTFLFQSTAHAKQGVTILPHLALQRCVPPHLGQSGRTDCPERR